MKMKKQLVCLITGMLLLFSAAAQQTPVPGLYTYTLSNGLELYVMENPAAPLAYIEIAVRAGGIAQTKETAGLFHLYEHMMFKGNSRYKTAAEVNAAFLDLGVTNWNGSTAAEYVNYFFTVPSSMLKEGLTFWSHAIRDPLLDPDELESEKNVVLSEVSGGFSHPSTIAYSAVQKNLFPDYPWRLDPGGSYDSISNATVEDLQAMQAQFYIPNNTALFVGGDVQHEEVYKLVKSIYGSWKRGPDPWAEPLPPQDDRPFEKPKYMVYPNPGMSPALAQVEIYYRGPDTSRNPEATYAADVWGNLIANPSGRYKQALLKHPEIGIPDPSYTAAAYVTKRDGGMIIFQSILVSPEYQLPSRVTKLYDTISAGEITKMIEDSSYFSEEEYKISRQLLKDQQIIERETVQGFLSNLRFWWASAGPDYYFTYEDMLGKVTHADIARFLENWVRDSSPLIFVSVNPSVYETQKKAFESAGYETVTADTAFWWND